MENSNIACSSGRLKIIDPNNFGGLDSSSNIPVNIEDLNISVVLTTFKKGRTILTASNEPANNTFNTQGNVSINFIDGSNINGKQVLTTNYTDLTTILDDNTSSNAGEGLGITSIDIDFNSQQAPMITINFIDVRGSAIFQNEENIKGGKNKYSTFFQLPYPLFKLTIKGYYGLPVEYCLHMYKFNSKFNSQTGNFEITANFIGFTYAMLSDMLIGYLKAIPYTKIGKERYELINDIRRKNGLDEIMNLNDLMIAIAKINESIKKLSADDVNSIEIANIDNKVTSLNGIIDIMNNLGSKLDIRALEIEKYLYIIKPEIYEAKPSVEKIIADYKDEIGKKLTEFNSNSVIQINTKLFDLPWYFTDRSINILNDSISKTSIPSETRGYAIVKYIQDVNNKLSDRIKNETIFDCWDLTDIFVEIDNLKIKLNESQKAAKENLGKTIKNTIKSKLFLDPTIRNIIEIFTTAVEVFMESIYTVSVAAEANPNTLRNNQLKNKFSVQGSVDIKNVLPSDNSILAWPGYREKKDIEGRESFTEKYLGAKNVLETPMDVNEIAFIEDLLKAFLEAAAKTDIATNITNEAELSWFPINPVDTRLFGIGISPYDRIGKNGLSSYKEVANLMLIRGMTFLGYNNIYLTTDEIEQMAEIDTMSMINTIKDTKAKLALGNLVLKDFVDLKGIINGKERNIIQLLNTDQYTYTYFPTNTINYSLKIIPITDGFNGTWEKNNDGIWKFSGPEESIFLTNYYNNKNDSKPIDGSIYVKIFTKNDFDVSVNLDTSGKPEKVDITNNKIVLANIKNSITNSDKAKKAGFNTFGGNYGIQEFVNMDWGDSSLDKLPLKYVFYDSNSEYGLTTREDANSKTPYDLGTYNFKSYNVTTYFDDTLLAASWSAKMKEVLLPTSFPDIGKNWNIMANFDPRKTSYPFVEAKYTRDVSIGVKYYYSLFGSRFYYGQSLSKYPLYSKALLFLSTLPWNGMPFEKTEILQLFNKRAGFIRVPKLWAAYVGGILWRESKGNPVTSPSDSSVIIGGGSGKSDPIIYRNGKEVIAPCNVDYDNWIGPNRYQNLNDLKSETLTFNGKIITTFEDLPEMLLYLPNQVKAEFKKIFFNFVDANSVNIGKNENSYDFKTFNNLVQLVSDGSLGTFDKKLDAVYTNIVAEATTSRDFGTIPTTDITNNLINLDKYQQVIPITDDNSLKRQISLMFKGTASDSTSPVGIIVGMMDEEVVIANSNYQIWEKPVDSKYDYYPIYCSNTNFELYFNKVVEIMKAKISSSAVLEEIKEKEQEIFGTSDADAIKFQLYKTCKNINDKWLGGVTNIDNIIFQCGGSKNSVDVGLRDKYRKGDNKTRLIDSFRFVDRAFADIGDLFYLNPVPINDYLINSPNTSIFDAVSQLLASNNFTFVPLPTFINYNDPDTLKGMFNTYPKYDEAIKDGVCGPSFVAVYAGDSSKHLDFGDSEYPNDGIDFQCGGPTKGDIINVPSDLIGTSNNYENDIAVFSVNYGQQNQNIFKDITLDQSEFSETDESLKISDDIAHKGTENNVSIGGQNIYNVYSVRSYKAEVEMLGNAMIQPMMHFQLNNIPMFHGGYLITRVKHSIKPNYMSTVFSGSRVRYPKTELLSGVDFYMGLLNSLNLSNAGSNTTGTVGASTQNGGLINGYVYDLKANIPTNKVIEGSVISNKLGLTQSAEKELKNWDNGKIVEKNGVAFLNIYATTTPSAGLSGQDYVKNNPWSAIFISYVMLAGDSNFPKSSLHYNYITAAMNGKFGYEAFALKSGLKIKPEVGDLICTTRNGGPTAGHCNVLYKVSSTTASFVGGNLSDSVKSNDIKLDGGYIIDSTDVNDYLIYIKKTNNKYYNNKKIIGTGNFDSGTSGKLETGTNADYWSLVAICALENSTPIGRCDVAQSIYNRLLSKKYSKSTIKELIVDKNQYEPVSRAKNEFLAIKNKETAITAYQKSKKVSNSVARKNIEETNTSLNDKNLIKNSKSFIGGRTDFYSSTIKDRIPSNGRKGLVERENQVFGWFVGSGAITYGETNPSSANKPDFSNVV